MDNNIIPWWDKLAYIINQTKVSMVNLPNQGTFDIGNKDKKLNAIARVNKHIKIMGEIEREKALEEIQGILKVKINKKLGKDLFLSWKDINEMNQNGMCFGSHTASHPNLEKVSLEIAKEEIIESKKKIEQELQKKVSVFCYPYGKIKFSNQDIVSLLKENVFFCAVSTEFGVNKINNKLNLYSLKRIEINYKDSFIKFRMKLNEVAINLSRFLKEGSKVFK
jgi:peptidoglycan/xylan/chitin deacetylase (PgdA/CDA1 family)